MSSTRHVVMLTTAGRGGMRAVVEAYAADGLLERWNARVLYSHVEGAAPRRALAAASSLAQFLVLLAQRRVALLHCHVSMGASFWRKALFANLARLFRVPAVLHLHGSDTAHFIAAQGRIGRRLIARELEQASRVVVLSGSWREFVLGAAPAARALVVPNYVGAPRAPAPAERDGIRVVFLGELGRRKGVYDLLPAWQRVAGRLPGATLLLAGNGETSAVAAEVERLRLGASVRLLGWVGGEEKTRLLAGADIFVLPSHNEGLPMSLLEAMSFGLAVISTRVGGIPDAVREGDEGLLLEPGDVDGLAAALERLASDAALRRRLGEAARRRVERDFSPAAAIARLDELYAELTGGRPCAELRAS